MGGRGSDRAEARSKAPARAEPRHPPAFSVSRIVMPKNRRYDAAGMSAMTRERFVEEIMRVVPAKFPLVKLSPGDEPFSMRVNGQMVGLENLYRLAVLSPADMRQQIERWIVELLRANEGLPQG